MEPYIWRLQGQWVKEMCYIETLKIVFHAAPQCKQVNRTSGALEQRVLRGVPLLTWHTHKPDIKNGFFYIHCSFGNFARRTTAMFVAKFQTNCTMAKKLQRNSVERLWHFSFGWRSFGFNGGSGKRIIISDKIWWHNIVRHTSSKYLWCKGRI